MKTASQATSLRVREGTRTCTTRFPSPDAIDIASAVTSDASPISRGRQVDRNFTRRAAAHHADTVTLDIHRHGKRLESPGGGHRGHFALSRRPRVAAYRQESAGEGQPKRQSA